MKLSPWIDEDHCSMRVVAGTDPKIAANRIAFIEKTPRVRILAGYYGVERNDDLLKHNISVCSVGENNIWISGRKGNGQECGKYAPSRKWCDDMLILFGHELG